MATVRFRFIRVGDTVDLLGVCRELLSRRTRTLFFEFEFSIVSNITHNSLYVKWPISTKSVELSASSAFAFGLLQALIGLVL